LYIESLLNLNWSDLSWFQLFNTVLSEETALAYFCQVGNPFYDPSSLNEHIYTRNLSAETMVRERYLSLTKLNPIFELVRCNGH